MIYHLLEPSRWAAVRDGAVVAEPGDLPFVHCCEERQIEGVRRRFFGGRPVVAVALDPTALGAETRYEQAQDVVGERFPHVYGPVRADEVLGATTVG